MENFLKKLGFSIFERINIPLLPFRESSIRFLNIFLKFNVLQKFFIIYLKACLYKKENKRIIFLTEKFIFKKQKYLPILDIHLQSLRNLSFFSRCIELSWKTIDLYPNSDIGYFHIIHALIHFGKISDASKIINLFNSNKIISERFSELSFANSQLMSIIKSKDVERTFRKPHLFFSDSGLIGQKLLKSNIKTNTNKINNFSIYISNHAGFCNTLVSVINAIGLAKLLSIKKIYVIKTKLTTELLLNICSIDRISITLSERPPTGDYISGYFFSHFDFIQTNNLKFKLQRKYFAHYLLRQFINKKISSKNDDLVIHIRSGDIFDSKLIHSKYGQPPLSFYLLAINHFQPKSITLIFEDFKNPIINLLISHINEINCKLKVQNKSSLKNSVSYLLNAKNVVCGNGTFVPGILLGSKNIKTLYIFEPPNDFKYRWSLERVKNFFKISDENGFYKKSILSKNWNASNSQLWLMKSYPINNLKLESNRKFK